MYVKKKNVLEQKKKRSRTKKKKCSRTKKKMFQNKKNNPYKQNIKKENKVYNLYVDVFDSVSNVNKKNQKLSVMNKSDNKLFPVVEILKKIFQNNGYYYIKLKINLIYNKLYIKKNEEINSRLIYCKIFVLKNLICIHETLGDKTSGGYIVYAFKEFYKNKGVFFGLNTEYWKKYIKDNDRGSFKLTKI